MKHYLPHLLLVLTTLFWSGNFVVARAVHLSIPPLSLSFSRWLLALLILLPWVWKPLRQDWPIIRRHWSLLLLLALLSVVSFNTCVYFGLQHTSATNGTLLQAVIPVAVMGLSALLLSVRIQAQQWLGVAISILGVAWVVSRGQPVALFGLTFNQGDLWILAAVLSWALYTVALKWRPDGLSDRGLLGTTVVLGVLMLLPLYLWELQRLGPIALSTQNLLALGYVAMFPSVLAYFFWNYGVARLGAAQAGLFIYLMPLFGMGLAILFLGERPQLYHLLGLVLVIGGIGLASRSGRSDP